MSRKYRLPKPFNYYWKKYIEGTCPFCNEESEMQSIENWDVIYCHTYGGYLSIYQDAAIAGIDGYCRSCKSTDPIKDDYYSVENTESTGSRTVIKGQGFLCESCGHGVHFDNKIMFQELFKLHDEKTCKHCSWHNKNSPNNLVKKPSN